MIDRFKNIPKGTYEVNTDKYYKFFTGKSKDKVKGTLSVIDENNMTFNFKKLCLYSDSEQNNIYDSINFSVRKV